MSYKILLIDDSITQLEMLRVQFAKAGFEVETATDGGDGYKKVFETAPDLILSDVIMPNLNGYQLCRLLKNNPLTSKIPVILLTVLDKKIDKFWGSESGADKFISKTSKYEETEENVRKIIGNNPIPEEYKNRLKSNLISDETVQNHINSVLDELLRDSTFSNEFRKLSEYISQEKVLVEKIFYLLGSFVEYNISGIFLSHPDKNEKNVLYLDVNKSSVSSFVLEKIKRDFFSQMPRSSEFSIRDFGHEVVRETVENDAIIHSASEFESVHIVPMVSDGRLLGGICFYNKEASDYASFKFYETMINQLGMMFKMRYLYSETAYLSVTDGLTGLYNRRHFEENLDREFFRTQRYPSDLSLAMIDIDHFKLVNDSFGHQFGDYVLREISAIIADSFRKTDMIYRYGGEELAIILTETSMQNASVPLERLRETIAEHVFEHNGQKTDITVSIGISTNYPGVLTQENLVAASDKALYYAKQKGRNKVVMYSNEEFSEIS